MMKDIEIKINRETRMVDLSKSIIGNDGENLQGNLVFSFVDDFVKGQARLEYVINNEKKYVLLLKGEDNYYIPIKSVMTKAGTIDMQLVVTEGTNENEIPIFKSNMFYVTCRTSINAEIEEEEEYHQWIEIANTKLNEVDEAIEELASQSNYAKEQGDYAKEQGTNAKNVADDTQKKAEEGKFNGKSLEFIWQGTKLGVRLEGQEEYQFVDLQGVQGEIGATGEPFKIKKTYASVSEMNADFRNMEFGDYVMIASSVDVEDNAKLYTRGESAWIFISDFSGAMGIRGETGLTPNIKIGEVKTLEAGSQAKVTRSGSNEEPVFNFELPKGDKGDDYVLTEEDKVEIGKKVNTEYEKRIEQNEKYISELEATIDILTNTDTKKGELVHITDALPLATFENKIDGNVKQETTRGVNLIDKNNYILDVNNRVGIDVSNLVIGEKYTFSSSVAINTMKISNISTGHNSVVYISESANGFKTHTFTMARDSNMSEDTKQYLFIKTNSTTWATDISQLGDLQIEKGSTATEYEPFTNGASPNPDYPQEIEVLEAYNLLPFTNQDFTLKGVHYYVQNGSLYLDGTSVDETNTTSQEFKDNFSFILPAGTYYFSRKNYNGATYLKKYSDNSNLVTNQGIIVLNEDTQVYIGLYIYQQIFANQKIKLLLVKGDKEKPYNPFSYISYKVNRKNLFDENEFYKSNFNNVVKVENGYNFDVIKSQNVYTLGKVKPNTPYTFKGKIIGTSGASLSITVEYTDGTKKYAYETFGDNSFKITTDGTKTLKSITFAFYNQGNFKNYTFEEVMLSEYDDDYEPYQEQIVPLDLKGNWVGAINDDIKDYLVTDKKKFWLVKNVGKVVLDGSENWILHSNSGDSYRYWLKDSYLENNFSNIFTNIVKSGEGDLLGNIFCTHFTQSLFSGTRIGTFSINIVDANYNIWFLLNVTETSVDNLKTWLSNNNVEVYYPTATTETIYLGELPEPIKTFEGVNNIQVLANLDTEIEVTYAQDVKKYFDNKIAEISAQII